MAVRDCFNCAPTFPEMMQRQRLESNVENTQASQVNSTLAPGNIENNAFNNADLVQRSATVNTVSPTQAITDSLIEASLESSKQTLSGYSANGSNTKPVSLGSLIDIKV